MCKKQLLLMFMEWQTVHMVKFISNLTPCLMEVVMVMPTYLEKVHDAAIWLLRVFKKKKKTEKKHRFGCLFITLFFFFFLNFLSQCVRMVYEYVPQAIRDLENYFGCKPAAVAENENQELKALEE